MARSDSQRALLVRALFASCALSAACDADANAALSCRLSPAHLVTRADAASFDAIAIDAATERALVVWSEPAGLFARAVSSDGKPSSSPVRLGERCTGGVDVALGARDVVACSRRGRDDEAGEVLVLWLDAAQHVTASERIGDAGRDGHGVDVALERSTALVVFHDGSRERHRVELAELAPGKPAQVRTLSRHGQAASEPTLLVSHGHRLYAWTETELDAQGSTTRVLVARDAEAPRAVLETHAHEPTPSLATDARGLVLTYRDRGNASHRAELYAARLDDTLARATKPRLIGRANGEGAPTVRSCGELLAALLPRDQASERYIAVHALDASLANASAGHQYYANSRDFVLASGACAGDALVFIAAERVTPADRGVELVGMRFSCAR